jgi:hypothetical protein
MHDRWVSGVTYGRLDILSAKYCGLGMRVDIKYMRLCCSCGYLLRNVGSGVSSLYSKDKVIRPSLLLKPPQEAFRRNNMYRYGSAAQIALAVCKNRVIVASAESAVSACQRVSLVSRVSVNQLILKCFV